jgi:hypothetical protein
MDVEIEEPHVHHHTTGHRWLDLVLPVAALFVSFVSIIIAWHHGEVMKELVHQNEKLVEANSLPYLQSYYSDLEKDLHTPAFRLTVENQGVGPARIAEVTVTVDGKPVPNFNTLLEHCCAPGLLAAADRGIDEYDGIKSGEVVLSTLRDKMIRPGESVDAIDWHLTQANRPVLDRLKSAFGTGRIRTSICYCSVFEDCWTRSQLDRRPVPVNQCSPASVAYRQ